ncbi:HK97 family phage prohead protease [Streptomyces sp. NPDC059247]|uniref:phage major capsid protein n=1 Tax=Streptomyces sp. NPDC059247 TaxID=3346790 RepID=UPI003699D758
MILRLYAPVAAVAGADEPPPADRAQPSRSVGGPILTYGVRAHPSGPFGSVTFAPGSLEADSDLSRVKLLRDHDAAQPLGHMAELTDSPTVADAEFAVGSHPAATEALALAAERVLDGFSVGVEPIEWTEDADGTGVTITRARLAEVSLVALPAYTDARAVRVAAQEGTPMNNPPAAPAPPPPAAPPPPSPSPDLPLTAADVAALRALLAAPAPEIAPPAAAPLTATAPLQAAAITTTSRLDAHGYSRPLPAVVVGRERVDACDYLAASLELMVHGNSGPWERVRRVLAAVVHETTALVPGLLPEVIVGPMLDQLAPERPVWLSLAPRAMPATSSSFKRVRVTQHTETGEQSAEKTELPNRPLKVSAEDVAKKTYGGWVNISRQVIDWTSPGALALIVQDLLASLVQDTEDVACAALVAAATDSVTGDLKDPAELNSLVYQAAAKVYGAVAARRTPADRVWMSPDVWAAIGSMVDGSKRPLFPALNPSNALGALRPTEPTGAGGDFVGFRPVVSPGLPAATLIVGASTAVEVYEDQRGTLQAVEPSVLGTQVAAYAYLATYLAQPKKLVALKQKAAGGAPAAKD